MNKIMNSPVVHTDENNRFLHFNSACDDNSAVVTFMKNHDKNCRRGDLTRRPGTYLAVPPISKPPPKIH